MTRGLGIVGAALVTTVALLGLGTGANAVTLASSPLFAGTAQANAVCYFLNVGNATVATPTITIRDEAGVAVPVPPAFNTCPSTGVLPGRTCGIGVFILNNQAYNCTIVSAGAVVTGGLELRNRLLWANSGHRAHCCGTKHRTYLMYLEYQQGQHKRSTTTSETSVLFSLKGECDV
jgi:hypothetical protein